MELLSIVGAGNVGKTLGKLWRKSGTVGIGGVLTRSMETAAEAKRFIGEGEAVISYAHLPRSTFYLLATPDSALEESARRLAEEARPPEDAVLFHCSGALPSEILRGKGGAAVASVHPIKSFSDPDHAARTFRGTYCGAEGEAVDRVRPLFESIGGRVFRLASSNKLVYHAASVFASNYLVTMLETSIGLFEGAGVDRSVALEAARLIAEGSSARYFDSGGSAGALTGPIARGDVELVSSQYDALKTASSLGELYAVLGIAAVRVARRKGTASAESLDAIEKVLRER